MADFIREIGGNTRLMIREGPGPDQFQFFVQTGPSTYNYQQPWDFGVKFSNGGIANSTRRTFRMEKGGKWQYMGMLEDMGGLGQQFEVRLTIHNTGLGFPTYHFWQPFVRNSRPDPPVPPMLTEFTPSSIRAFLDWGFDGGPSLGGLPVLESEIWWSWDTTPRFVVNTKDHVFTGLHQKTNYFFWGKLRNDLGWSDLSGRSVAETHGVPDAPIPVFFHHIGQDRVIADLFVSERWKDGGRPIEEWQIGYGKNPNTPEFFVTGPRVEIRNLDPGMRYYFWARGRNAYGWGAWSVRSEVLLVAGARIPVDGIYRRAVPYIKVDGVWRLARPWAKNAGFWKEST